MAKKNMTFIVDTFESDYSPVGIVKQLDSVIFNITVTENSTIKSLNNQNIKLFAKKPDKTKVEQTEGINITNSTNGELTIDLKNSALQSVGLVYFELELKDSEGTISTANFIIRVDEKLGSNEAIESTNEFDTFEKIKLEEQKRQESEKERDKIFKGLITEGTEFNGSLENNINLAETLNTNLAENIKLAGPLNTSLNEKIPEAATKKSELESSIVEAKKFIDGLDGSQNIPGIRMELTELQNGLKSNQNLSYEGISINAENTLEGRT
ncbi:BppU family phage baseplate upper protein, partial [Clostridium perfringens]